MSLQQVNLFFVDELAVAISPALENRENTHFSLGLTYDTTLAATVSTVAELGRSDVDRRSFLGGAVFATAASTSPSRDWLLATLEESAAVPKKVGSAQVVRIREAFAGFQELDVMRGGGHARHLLASYLTSHVVPLLEANDPETLNGQELYEAAAEQLYLLGWMAFDNGEHPLAQRYLIQALRLAQAANRPQLGAHVLAGLSDQATLTGDPKQGLQLARTGIAGLNRHGGSHACLADLLALQGRAEAAMGDTTATIASVQRSEEAFGKVRIDDEPEWARFIDRAYLNGEYAHAYRDLHQPHETARFAAISAAEAKRQGRARRGCLANATIARAALDNHDLDGASEAGIAAIRLGAAVTSSRSRDAVADLHGRLKPHSKALPTVEFNEAFHAFAESSTVV
jgi:hypothetical protein